jgi:hypothetical protein
VPGQFLSFIVLNHSDTNRFIDVPFPTNGVWQELINGGSVTTTDRIGKLRSIALGAAP